VLVLDPDGLGSAMLRETAGAAGFVLEERLGPRVAYFPRFRGAA
jgi:hypothetical protein